ncbi:MAG: hypothetical protein E7671_04655 [Ruminococcaceae bacterium]|nr:hypothetical protein [Oscillospiraceae bacterium]
MTYYVGVGRRRASSFIFLGIVLCTFVVLIKNPDIAIGYMRRALRLCAHTVVPSLFPFTVLSGLFVELGCADLLARFLGRPMRFLFGISGEGSAAPLMGALCGFPVGAITANRLYESGRISGREMGRLLVFSNNPSSAFLISAVGTSLWSCPRLGSILFIFQLIISLIIGITLRFLFPLETKETAEKRVMQSVPSIRTFTKVMAESAISMLNICALVLFFASIVGALVSILEVFGIGQTAKTLIYGFFEMSGAVGEAARITSKELGLVLTALICGWSGISVHFQVMSVCSNAGISFVPYFVSKGFQGIFSALFMLLYIKFIDSSLLFACVPTFAADNLSKGNTALAVAANAVFLISIILCFFLHRAHRPSVRACGHSKR